MPIKLQKLPAAVRWGLAVLCAAVCGVLWAYYWRVFFGLDDRVSPLVVTLGCAAFLEVCLLAGYCVRRFAKEFAAKGAVCIFLCGLLFAFANPGTLILMLPAPTRTMWPTCWKRSPVHG